jgi:hypothetical protein
MQSHEKRADEMLRMMGGSLSVTEQRNVLRRLILAEDMVIDLQAEVSVLRSAFEHLERDHGCKAYNRAPVSLR